MNRFPKRKIDFGDHQRNNLIDRIIEALNDLVGTSSSGESSGDSLFNNSAASISGYTILGRDSSGVLVPAIATEPGKIDPLYQALRTIQPSQRGPGKMIGTSRVILESPAETITARGAIGWLSTSVAGRVTLTKPTSGWAFMICSFSETVIDDAGTAACWLNIFTQGALTI